MSSRSPQAQSHSLALRSDGTVVAWAAIVPARRNVPTDLTNAMAIAAGGNDSLALPAATVQLPLGRTTPPGPGPMCQLALTNVIAIAAGTSHNIGIAK